MNLFYLDVVQSKKIIENILNLFGSSVQLIVCVFSSSIIFVLAIISLIPSYRSDNTE